MSNLLDQHSIFHDFQFTCHADVTRFNWSFRYSLVFSLPFSLPYLLNQLLMKCASTHLNSHYPSRLDDTTETGVTSSNPFSTHIVSLTSTTYDLLTFDPPPSTPPSRFTLGSLFPSEPEVINLWDLISNLNIDNFCLAKPKENYLIPLVGSKLLLTKLGPTTSTLADRLEKICPMNWEKHMVI